MRLDLGGAEGHFDVALDEEILLAMPAGDGGAAFHVVAEVYFPGVTVFIATVGADRLRVPGKVKSVKVGHGEVPFHGQD